MNIASLVDNKKNPKIPALSPGDTVKVSARIVEGGKERIQVFQGVVIQVRPGGAGASFTVRHVAFGIGVERTFPFYSPLIEKVEIVRHGKVRRSKLYYLRKLSGRQARRKIKRVDKKVEAVGGELLEPESEEVLEPEAVAEAAPEAEAEVVEEATAEVTEEPAAEVEEKPEAAVVEEPAAEVEEKPEAVAEAAPEAEAAVVEEPAAEAKAGIAEEPAAEVEEKPEATSEKEEDKPKDAKS